jgi:hypothetical protein
MEVLSSGLFRSFGRRSESALPLDFSFELSIALRVSGMIAFGALVDVLSRARCCRESLKVTLVALRKACCFKHPPHLEQAEPLTKIGRILELIAPIDHQANGAFCEPEHDRLKNQSPQSRGLFDGSADLGEWIAVVSSTADAVRNIDQSSIAAASQSALQYLSQFIKVEAAATASHDVVALLEQATNCLARFCSSRLQDASSQFHRATMLLAEEDDVAPWDSQSTLDPYTAFFEIACATVEDLSRQSEMSADRTDVAVSRVVHAMDHVVDRLRQPGCLVACEGNTHSLDMELSELLLTAVEACHMELASLNPALEMLEKSSSFGRGSQFLQLLRLSAHQDRVRGVLRAIRQLVSDEGQFLSDTLLDASRAITSSISACNEFRQREAIAAETAARARIFSEMMGELSFQESLRSEELAQLLRAQHSRRARQLLSPLPISPPPSPAPVSDIISVPTTELSLPSTAQSRRDVFFATLKRERCNGESFRQFSQRCFAQLWSFLLNSQLEAASGEPLLAHSDHHGHQRDLSDLAVSGGLDEDTTTLVPRLLRILCRLEQLLADGRSALKDASIVHISVPFQGDVIESAALPWLYEMISFYECHGDSRHVASDRGLRCPYIIPSLPQECEPFFKRHKTFGFLPIACISQCVDPRGQRLLRIGFEAAWACASYPPGLDKGCSFPDTHRMESAPPLLLSEMLAKSLDPVAGGAHHETLVATALMRRLLFTFCKLQKSLVCAEFYHCPLEMLDRAPCLSEVCIVPRWTVNFCRLESTELKRGANGINMFLGLLPPPMYQLLVATHAGGMNSVAADEPVADTVALLAMAILRAACVGALHDTARAIIEQVIQTAVELDSKGVAGVTLSKSSPASLYRFTEDQIWAPMVLNVSMEALQQPASPRSGTSTAMRGESSDLTAQPEAEVSVNLLEVIAARRRWHHLDDVQSSPLANHAPFPFRASTGSVTAVSPPAQKDNTGPPVLQLCDAHQSSLPVRTFSQQQLQNKFDELLSTPRADPHSRLQLRAAASSSVKRQRKFAVDSSSPTSASSGSFLGVKQKPSSLTRCCAPADEKLRFAVQGILLATDHCGIFAADSLTGTTGPTPLAVGGSASQSPRTHSRLRAACPSHRSPFRVTSVEVVRNDMLCSRFVQYRDGMVQCKRAHSAAERSSPFLVTPVDELTSIANSSSAVPPTFCPAQSARFLLESLHEFDPIQFPLVGACDGTREERESFVNEVVLMMGTTREHAVQIVSEGLSHSEHRRNAGGIVASYTQQNPVKPGYHFVSAICHAHALAKPTLKAPSQAADKENSASTVGERVVVLFRVALGSAVLANRSQPQGSGGVDSGRCVSDSLILGDSAGHCDFVVTHRDAAVPILVVHYASH